jgi:di/tripeptidase
MTPEDFKELWHRLDEANQERLIQLAQDGVDRFVAHFEKSAQYASAVSAAHDATPPSENQKLLDKCQKLMAASGDELLTLGET